MLTKEQAAQLQSLIKSRILANDQLHMFSVGWTNMTYEQCVSQVKNANDALNTYIMNLTEEDT